MALSVQAIESLLDLVEIKLGAMEVYDADDARAFATLEATRRELNAQLVDRTAARRKFKIVTLNGKYLHPARSAA
ncbi:MAG: hypothetical protein HOK82_00205 [Rhodospirillaceae bacterium]|jgi:hypothetical protein|nr:hypothetical protein [Rhodospirillaceae bacterium]